MKNKNMLKMTKNSKCLLYVGVGFVAFVGVVLVLFKTLDKIYDIHQMMELDRLSAVMPPMLVHHGNDQMMNGALLEDVAFCGKVYKVNKVMVGGVDVVPRIAQIATLHPKDGVCESVAANQSDNVVTATVTLDPNQKDYTVVLVKTFGVSGGKIYLMNTTNNSSRLYGTLK